MHAHSVPHFTLSAMHLQSQTSSRIGYHSKCIKHKIVFKKQYIACYTRSIYVFSNFTLRVQSVDLKLRHTCTQATSGFSTLASFQNDPSAHRQYSRPDYWLEEDWLCRTKVIVVLENNHRGFVELNALIGFSHRHIEHFHCYVC